MLGTLEVLVSLQRVSVGGVKYPHMKYLSQTRNTVPSTETMDTSIWVVVKSMVAFLVP